jgi:transposase InsO family protein
MDFIVVLPESNSHTKIWVIVDRFTKMAHFLPLSTDTPIKDLANLYLKEVWRLHGLTSTAVSDRDSCFLSKFWVSLMELLKVDIRLSTAFHPQTDEQTERVNRVLEQYLRSYCSYQQDDWAELQPLVEHAYNSPVSESTMMSPFEANYGFSPHTNWPEGEKRKYDNIGSPEVLQDWTVVWRELRDNLDKAQTR